MLEAGFGAMGIAFLTFAAFPCTASFFAAIPVRPVLFRRYAAVGAVTALAAGLTACGGADKAGLLEPTIPSATQADIFADGLAAYDRGEDRRALALWLTLARHGNLTAMRNVGMMLEAGQGIAPDPERALKFYQRAAANGLPGAQVNLAALYRSGRGTEKNPRKAIDWLYVAASANQPLAIYYLGEMAEAGEGMTADREKALKLYRLAAARGLPQARDRLRALGEAVPDGAPAPGLTLSALGITPEELWAGTEPLPAPARPLSGKVATGFPFESGLTYFK